MTRPATRVSIGYVGLGVMGEAMVRRLVGTGFRITVYNRTRPRADSLACDSVVVAASPAEAARDVDVVLLSLADEQAVDAILFGSEGVARGLRPNAVVVDTSTVAPAYAQAAEARLARFGVRRVEACVLGNPFQAQAGELRLFTSGAPRDVDDVRFVLDALAKDIVYVGPAGKAATMKLVFNALLGAQLVSLAEAITYGVGAGLDREHLIAAIASSGFSSKVMSFRAAFMQSARYEPAAFRTRLMEKDLRRAIQEAGRVGIEMPVVAVAARRFSKATEAGRADLDAAAILVQQEDDRGGIERWPGGTGREEQLPVCGQESPNAESGR